MNQRSRAFIAACAVVVVVSGFSRTVVGSGVSRIVVGSGFSRTNIEQSPRTVRDGVYTAAQAERGQALYKQSCGGCHRDDLRGDNTAPSLVGESFLFLWGEMSVGALLTRVRAIMPPDRPSSLPAQSYVDIIAFILQKNAFPAGDTELGLDQSTLAQILITAKRP